MFERNNFGNYNELIGSYTQAQTITTINNARFINQIILNNQNINFYSSTSEDGGRKLDSIWVGSKRIYFSYNYFVSSPSDDTKNSKRLKLLAVTESYLDIEENSNPKSYTFEYSSVGLPKKDSKSVDHWGYFNNKNNSSLIPSVSYGNFTYSGADRNPDASFASACILKKINYPSGGNSEFIFQGNTYKVTSSTIFNSQSSPVFITGTNFNTEVCSVNQFPNLNSNYIYFDFRVHAEVSISDLNNYSPNHHRGKVEITNDALQTLFSGTVTYNNPIDQSFSFNPLQDMASIKICANGSVTTTSAWISYKYYDPNASEPEVQAGGVRIYQIKNYDQISNKTETRTFDYENSGYLNNNIPDYYTITTDSRLNEYNFPQDYQRILIFSSPVGGLGNSSCSVSYEKVTEYLGTISQNNGKIETIYNYYTDQPVGGSPYLPQLSYQWLRSKVIEESYYSRTSQDSYEKKKTFSYSYESDTNNIYNIKGFKASRIKTNSLYDFPDYPNLFAYTNFDLWSYNYRLKQKITHVFSSGTNDLIKQEDFFYDNPFHLNATRIETLSSDGAILKTVFKYPLDYISCPNNCKDQYIEDIESCKLTYGECNREIETCRDIIDYALGTYFECMHSWELYTIANCNPVTERCMRISLNEFDCHNEFEDYLESNGYQTCLQGIDCEYNACQISSNNSYLTCLDNYYGCIIDLYENASNPFDKGIYLLALNNIHNTLIERITYNNSNEIEHYRLNFQEVNDMPVIKNVELKYGNQNYFPVISNDQFDSYNNITQATPKNIDVIESYIWSYKGKYLVAKVTNSTVDKIAFTSFETDDDLGGWNFTGIILAYNPAKTGHAYANITSSNNITTTKPPGTYYLDFYTQGTITVTGGTVTNVMTSSADPNGWMHVIKKLVLNSSTTITLSGNTYIDELRLYPINSLMTSYTYDPLIGMTSMTDENNVTTYYEYDGFGRLQRVLDQDRKVIKQHEYHYQDQTP